MRAGLYAGLGLMLLFSCMAPSALAAASEEPRELAGAMLLAGFHGTRLDDPRLEKLRRQIVAGQVAGVVLFAHNIVDAMQLRQLVGDLRRLPAPRPLLIAVDQEGGRVQRLTAAKGFTDFPAAVEVAGACSPEEAFWLYRRMAAQLRDYGINVNLAPVVDVALNPDGPVISRLGRAFSDDPGVVGEYATRFVAAHRREGVFTALKHFPGHGSADADTHLGAADVSGLWQPEELSPYARLLEHGMVDMVMMAHVFHQELDEQYPASLSRQIVTGLLREQLGWQGVVISDDLQMGAIEERFGLREVVEQAVLAGNDLLLFSNFHSWDPDLPDKVADILGAAVAEGRVSLELLRASRQRLAELEVRIGGAGSISASDGFSPIQPFVRE